MSTRKGTAVDDSVRELGNAAFEVWVDPKRETKVRFVNLNACKNLSRGDER